MKSKIILSILFSALISFSTCFAFVGGGGSGGAHGSGSSRASSHGYSSSSRNGSGHHSDNYYSSNDLHPESVLDVLGLFAFCLIIVLAAKKYLFDANVFKAIEKKSSATEKNRIKYLKSCKHTASRNINKIEVADIQITLDNLYNNFCCDFNDEKHFKNISYKEIVSSIKALFLELQDAWLNNNNMLLHSLVSKIKLDDRNQIVINNYYSVLRNQLLDMKYYGVKNIISDTKINRCYISRIQKISDKVFLQLSISGTQYDDYILEENSHSFSNKELKKFHCILDVKFEFNKFKVCNVNIDFHEDDYICLLLALNSNLNNKLKVKTIRNISFSLKPRKYLITRGW